MNPNLLNSSSPLRSFVCPPVCCALLLLLLLLLFAAFCCSCYFMPQLERAGSQMRLAAATAQTLQFTPFQQSPAMEPPPEGSRTLAEVQAVLGECEGWEKIAGDRCERALPDPTPLPGNAAPARSECGGERHAPGERGGACAIITCFFFSSGSALPAALGRERPCR